MKASCTINDYSLLIQPLKDAEGIFQVCYTVSKGRSTKVLRRATLPEAEAQKLWNELLEEMTRAALTPGKVMFKTIADLAGGEQ